MIFVSTAVIAAMAYYSGQENMATARLFSGVLTAMFPSLATVTMAVTAIVNRRR